VCIADLHQPPWSEIYRPLTERRVMRSELAVPLLGPGDGLEGVVNVESPNLAHFDAEAQTVLESLATQATIALQEARLLDTIEEVTERMVGHPPDAVFAGARPRHDLLNIPTPPCGSWKPRPTACACGPFAYFRQLPCGGRQPAGAGRAHRQPVVSIDWPAINAWWRDWRTAWAGTRR
jgi:hypothetical protein